jgi:hypothetical protein
MVLPGLWYAQSYGNVMRKKRAKTSQINANGISGTTLLQGITSANTFALSYR